MEVPVDQMMKTLETVFHCISDGGVCDLLGTFSTMISNGDNIIAPNIGKS
jgi:hypothetical protein